jgi:hypothetical protein
MCRRYVVRHDPTRTILGEQAPPGSVNSDCTSSGGVEVGLSPCSLNQTLRKRTSFCPFQHIEQSKCIKLTIDTNIHLTLYRRTIENCKNVSFALLNGWNVTKTSFDHA